MQPNNDGFNQDNMSVPPVVGAPAPIESQPPVVPAPIPMETPAPVPSVAPTVTATDSFSQPSMPVSPLSSDGVQPSSTPEAQSQPAQMDPPVIEQPKPAGFMGKLKSIFTKKV
jgi:hypothetical protein